MFSGKTSELIRRIERALFAKQKVLFFSKDTRNSKGKIKTHSGRFFNVTYVDSAEDILQKVTTETEVIGIDEGQFFGSGLCDVCMQLSDEGKRVIITCLDQDSENRPFENILNLLAQAEYVDKLSAICECGDPATRTYRLIESTERILEGSEDLYTPLCRHCYLLRKRNL